MEQSNPQKKLLLLGGSHAEIPLIQAAHELGWYVITTGNNRDGLGHPAMKACKPFVPDATISLCFQQFTFAKNWDCQGMIPTRQALSYTIRTSTAHLQQDSEYRHHARLPSKSLALIPQGKTPQILIQRLRSSPSLSSSNPLI